MLLILYNKMYGYFFDPRYLENDSEIVSFQNFHVSIINSGSVPEAASEIRIIDQTIAGVSRPSHGAMAVIPTTVEFVHCELDAICSVDLLRCHTGSPLDQFVSQSHRYRRRRRSSSSSSRVLFEPEKSTHERCD